MPTIHPHTTTTESQNFEPNSAAQVVRWAEEQSWPIGASKGFKIVIIHVWIQLSTFSMPFRPGLGLWWGCECGWGWEGRHGEDHGPRTTRSAVTTTLVTWPLLLSTKHLSRGVTKGGESAGSLCRKESHKRVHAVMCLEPKIPSNSVWKTN